VPIAEPRDQGIRIVLDHPRRHAWRRLGRSVSTLAGGLLLVVGLTASIPALPATLAVAGLVVGWIAPDASNPEPWPPPDLPVPELLIGWAVSLCAAIVGIRAGLRLLRRHRTLVLFLRRFGHDEAQSAVTFAVVETIGPSWRVVTLDDAEIVPLGVTDATRRVFDAGRFTTRHLGAIGLFLGLRLFPVLLIAGWTLVAFAVAPVALDFALTGVTSPEPWIAAVEPLMEILVSALDGRLPLHAIELSLPGVFALVVTAATVSFVVMMATMAALLLALPFSTVLFFLSSSAESVQEAERSKSIAVSSRFEIQQAAHAIAARSRKVFGPRLVVVRAASHVWQDAVRTLAALAPLRLIDISEPTAHVVWEIEELRRLGGPSVLIGHHDRVVRIASPAAGSGTPTSAERRLAQLLEGHEVLAYTTDPRGLRRFARALRGMLLSADAASSELPALTTPAFCRALHAARRRADRR
jgi:hypothetical protein